VGLDLYVGTLTRYLVGDWELVTEKAAREAGLAFELVRTQPEPEDAIRDPDVVRDAVLDWRTALSEALGADLSWAEADAMPYFTDKPDWSGYAALMLVAAHVEHPELALPDEVPEQPLEHPLAQAVLAPPKRGLFRRSRTPEPQRYYTLYGPELFLPVDVDGVWHAPFVTGDDMQMSSAAALLAQLRELADRRGAGPAELERWRETGGIGSFSESLDPDGRTVQEAALGSLEEVAGFGLAVFLELAEQAVEHRLPLKLDY
jgi:hypothetical protein